jgi:hypothetical protein
MRRTRNSQGKNRAYWTSNGGRRNFFHKKQKNVKLDVDIWGLAIAFIYEGQIYEGQG